MTVYLSASLSKHRKLLPLVGDIGQMIEEFGHTVTSKHVLKKETTSGEWEDRYEPKALFEREMRRLANSDVLITEATTPSYGGGFMIEMAIMMGKPLLTLHYGTNEKDAPLMLRGHREINLHIYNETTIKTILKRFLDDSQKNIADPLPDFDQ